MIEGGLNFMITLHEAASYITVGQKSLARTKIGCLFSSKSVAKTGMNNDIIPYPSFQIMCQHIFGGLRRLNKFYNE
jgi:hypothetical protein